MSVAAIEQAIALRRFDMALEGVADLQAAAATAMKSGAPDALAALHQTLLEIDRLLLLARAERAHMAAELRFVTGAASYQPMEKQPSSWRIDA